MIRMLSLKWSRRAFIGLSTVGLGGASRRCCDQARRQTGSRNEGRKDEDEYLLNLWVNILKTTKLRRSKRIPRWVKARKPL